MVSRDYWIILQLLTTQRATVLVPNSPDFLNAPRHPTAGVWFLEAPSSSQPQQDEDGCPLLPHSHIPVESVGDRSFPALKPKILKLWTGRNQEVFDHSET